jgi:hypothetical protein
MTSEMVKKPSPNFRKTLASMRAKKIVVPVIRAMAADIQMKSFSIPVEGPTKRAYDGWFHPSTHPTWTARQLYYYLTKPEALESEEMDVSSVFAISQGHFFHAMLQQLLLSNGMLKAAEVPLSDPHHNRRGHMDGDLGKEGLEIKTMNEFTIAKIETWQDLLELKPGYYAQAMDYLDMSGREAMRFVIMSTTYPFSMTEVVVPRDERYMARQRAKYREAIEAAEAGVPPEPCRGCGIGSEIAAACPVLAACPVGRR